MAKKSVFFFDAKDYELLRVVNQLLSRDSMAAHEPSSKQIYAALHPHGIKELTVSQEIRVAYAVANLLDSLEVGQATDRITALQALRDEVLYSASTTFRYNTGRVLIQIMKSLVRAHGRPEEQLRLAHDFRAAATGKRRIIRHMLKRYHLLEMPEEWNQLSFDHHVHDANTKGRKSATHLIMDAWIKGIRKLDVVYYNYVEPAAVQELMQAAAIMDISVHIGVEFQARFHNRYVQFIWQPHGFHDYHEMFEFLKEKPVQHLMRMGREASVFHHNYVMRLLARYNQELRHEIGARYCLELSTIDEAAIPSIVGMGQTSRTHLAELIFREIKTAFIKKYNDSFVSSAETGTEREAKLLCIQRINKLTPEIIVDEWLTYEKNPDIDLPVLTSDEQSGPEIMRLLPTTLIDWLTSIRSASHVILNLNNLRAEDVLELLYECEGMITHLELFNLKNYNNGKMEGIRTISMLQSAINEGNGIILKRLIRSIIKDFEHADTPEQQERLKLFQDILRNIPLLQNYYRTVPLRTKIGSDSTSRSNRMNGMGFVFTETIPERAKKEFAGQDSRRQRIPLTVEVYSVTTHYPKIYQTMGSTITNFLRTLPWLQKFNTRKEETWIADEKRIVYTNKGNIATLGGFTQESPLPHPPAEAVGKARQWQGVIYLNTTIKNILKVLIGFSLTCATFAFTQTWWVLVWFGPVIWFAITGLRNVLQALLSGGGLKRSPLLRWNDYISWSRICDSLLFTGMSVPLLEFGVRWLLLGQICGLNSISNPVIFFTIISLVNGTYIAAHNLFRGFPKEAVVGNIFRSFLAIPISMLYNIIAQHFFLLLDLDPIYLQQGAAVLSKLASDSVAAIIEGFADKVEYLRRRYWDYKAKLEQLFSNYERLELLLPDADALEALLRPKEYLSSQRKETEEIEKTLIINALDLMYFWMYQPRARQTFIRLISALSEDEKKVLAQAQKVLLRVQEVSQFFVSGLVGSYFARPLAFYLEKHEEYLHDMDKFFNKTKNSK